MIFCPKCGEEIKEVYWPDNIKRWRCLTHGLFSSVEYIENDGELVRRRGIT